MPICALIVQNYANLVAATLQQYTRANMQAHTRSTTKTKIAVIEAVEAETNLVAKSEVSRVICHISSCETRLSFFKIEPGRKNTRCQAALLRL